MKPLNSNLLRKFIKIAGDKLTGDWVMIGGTVLPMLGVEHRSTVDIDFVPVHLSSQEDALKLMQIAEDLGLPVEAINQAGAHFLKKIPFYREHLVEVHQGKSARIFRPSVTLFLLLKIGRLSESDLLDCLEYLKLASKQKENCDKEKVNKLIKSELKTCDSEGRRQRLQSLAKALR